MLTGRAHPVGTQAAQKKSLWDMGLDIFGGHLSGRPEVLSKTVDGLLKLIENERRGDQVQCLRASARACALPLV